MYFQTQFSVNIRTLNQFSNSTFRETSVSVQYSWVYTNTTPSVNTLKNARNTGVVDIVFIFERNCATSLQMHTYRTFLPRTVMLHIARNIAVREKYFRYKEHYKNP